MKILLTILSLIYVLMPYDLLPDFLIGWGWMDDFIILYLLWRYFFKGGGWPFQKRPSNHRENNRAFARDGKQGAGPEKEEDRDTARHRQGRYSKDPHEVLGVASDATAEEIKRAYKGLAAKYHPDKVLHLGDEFKMLAEKRFKEIQDAYQKLSGK